MFVAQMLHMVCTRISAMRKDWDKIANTAHDAALGYTAVILGIACFMIAMTVVVALVRLITSAGA